MLVFYGMSSSVKKELWAGNMTCPHCGQQSDFYTYRSTVSPTIFFIPICTFTKEAALVCENCGYSHELKKKEYKELKQKQFEMIENGTYPKEKLLVDCSPKAIGLPSETVKLFILGIWALFALLPILLLIQYPEKNTVEGTMVSMLFFIPAFMLPFYFKLKKYRKLLKIKEVYNNQINI